MATDDGASGSGDRRVVLFRRGGVYSPAGTAAASGGRERASPVSDLAEFERTKDQDDYGHRMMVNAAALAFTVALAAAGIWIAESMAVIRKNQDCVLMGRRACSPVPVPTADGGSGSGGGGGVSERRP